MIALTRVKASTRQEFIRAGRCVFPRRYLHAVLAPRNGRGLRNGTLGSVTLLLNRTLWLTVLVGNARAMITGTRQRGRCKSTVWLE